jgi:hypothetical protein
MRLKDLLVCSLPIVEIGVFVLSQASSYAQALVRLEREQGQPMILFFLMVMRCLMPSLLLILLKEIVILPLVWIGPGYSERFDAPVCENQ